MEKTWEVKEKEIRGEIAQLIEYQIENMMPPVDEAEIAVYHALTWAASVARGDNEAL